MKNYSNADLISFIDRPPKIIFPFRCHTQMVERHIPLISKISEKLTENQRHGYILQKLKSRKMNPNFNSKHEYNFASST